MLVSRSLGVKPARMTLSLVAIASTSSPLTYACGSFAGRYIACPGCRLTRFKKYAAKMPTSCGGARWRSGVWIAGDARAGWKGGWSQRSPQALCTSVAHTSRGAADAAPSLAPGDPAWSLKSSTPPSSTASEGSIFPT